MAARGRKRGRIDLILGCMFAGKTTELLRRCNKHKIAGKKVLRVKFLADKRYKGVFEMCTHNGLAHEAYPVRALVELGELWQ